MFQNNTPSSLSIPFLNKNLRRKIPPPKNGILLEISTWDQNNTISFLRLINVFVDDFIKIYRANNRKHLWNISQDLLHSVQNLFPTSNLTGNNGEDPIYRKKLDKGKVLWD